MQKILKGTSLILTVPMVAITTCDCHANPNVNKSFGAQIKTKVHESLNKVLEKRFIEDEIQKFKEMIGELKQEIHDHKNELSDNLNSELGYMSFCDNTLELVENLAKYLKNPSNELMDEIIHKTDVEEYRWLIKAVMNMAKDIEEDSEQ